MALTQRLDIRQSQQLVMTPQLQQAIKLLQYSSLDLQAFVAAELEKNPFLDTPEADSGGDTASETESPGDSLSENMADMDVNLSVNVYNNDSAADGVGAAATYTGGGGSADGPDAIDLASEDLSLADYLRAQMQTLPLSGEDSAIAAHLVDCVDEGGYLRETSAEIAERLGTGETTVEHVVKILQGMEPAGLFARSIEECLALQLKDRNHFDPCMACLLDNLDLLAKGEFPKLRKLCGVDEEDFRDMLAELRSLTPKPGLSLGSGEPLSPAIPDVIVKRGPQGQWQVELNSEALPRVLVNERYYTELAAQPQSREGKTFISENFANANWLVKALDQRARTILKVATEIVTQQRDFLSKGVRHLKPMNLRRVAEAIEMHESTVSRVTSNKYMATPRGLLEMKFFFTSGVGSEADGGVHSAESVKARIRELVDREDPRKILSDDKLVRLLKQDGVAVARRTVAKYRESMHIPSSVERRRLKRQAS